MGLLLGEKRPKISDIGFRTVESKKVSYMMIVWYLLNPSFLSSIIFTIEITRVLSLVFVVFPSEISSSIQQRGISFTSGKFSGKEQSRWLTNQDSFRIKENPEKTLKILLGEFSWEKKLCIKQDRLTKKNF